MKLVDIHSHILPGIDDGASDVSASLEMLKMMKEQGITDVISTPHFDASLSSIEEFNACVENSLKTLSNFTYGEDIPNIYIGCEVYYFPGISKSSGIKQLCLNNSKYLLIELCYGQDISDRVLKEICYISSNFGLVPIIAHIERYYKEKGFKKLLKLVANGYCLAQINAMSLMEKQPYKKVCIKLLKGEYISFIATDAHCVEHRPPLMDTALEAVKSTIGEKYIHSLLNFSDEFYTEVIAKNK